MTATDLDWTSRARGLADLLRDHGDIRSPRWHAAVAEVPRHVFVPCVYEQDGTGAWVGWETSGKLDRVYAPQTLVTVLEDRGGYREPVSSSTNPELMVRMLETLDIRDGHRVLEIGTGTGYNAGLLSHRLGDGRVFSVDVDAGLVELARERLARVGYRPALAAVDGEQGLPEHAPYDRIIATCSVPVIPDAWVKQLTRGGGLLADLKLAISAGNLVHLHTASGGGLEGRFVARQASFMAMRHHRDDPIPLTGSDVEPERFRSTEAPVPPWSQPVVWFLAQLSGLPRGIVFGTLLDPETRQPTTATLTAPDGSWARASFTDRRVAERGEVALWEPVERAHARWVEAGRPAWDRLGLTVGPDGDQWVWIDEPGGQYRWKLPTGRG
ncbi:methyltransferase domain-containing protein [Amycolatopsis sp. GM8]|uniref:methyltransferase domain-containing protein n=1 Tax=Amycolatopsis sp. GM8 TaxID=2896530 RepID=UPI001F2CB189|nr:methyltransferase domain-containing protein [Amycolatopsis sp. GM8]